MSEIIKPGAGDFEFLARLSKPAGRRTFLKWAGASSLVLAAGCGDDDDDNGGTGPDDDAVVTLPLTSDTDILKFALFLELLEADFYTRAVAAGILSGTVLEIATGVRDNEQAHVDFLQSALAGEAFDEDDVEFDFGQTLSSQDAFIDAAVTFEQTGVGAYLGALPLIDSRSIRRSAGTIFTVEARHTSVFRALNGEANPVPRSFEEPLTAQQVVTAVTPFVERGL
ncbi:MAG: ferritin-like domain-containing protein [Gemmatimonadetes bacterium]|nr:ferritin-like domain-containing protein [Gemmatimonadota bacterium]